MPEWAYLEVYVDLGSMRAGQWIDSTGRSGKLPKVQIGGGWLNRAEYLFSAPLCNELGADGWELTDVVEYGDGSRLFFKCPRT